MRLPLAALLLAALPAAAIAQDPPVKDPPVQAKPVVHAEPALWVVKDADTTIYLFGTIHVLKPGIGWFEGRVKRAFEASDALVLEEVSPDPAAMQALVAKLGYNPTGPTLTERLPEPNRTAYVKAVTGMGLPAGVFDRAKPWLAAVNLSLLPVLKLGYDPANGPETVLTKAATDAHKPLTGLETAAQQLGYFDGIAPKVQVRFLESTVRDLPDTARDIDTMVADWSRGDAKALAKTLNDDIEDSPELAKVLLKDRNRRWADWIEARMKQPGIVFIAVGAGHLAGRDSVQAQLAKHHLTAVRVTN